MGMQDTEDLTDVMTALDRVPQRLICADAIEVAPAFALPVEIAGIDEVAHDPLRGTFGDAHPFSDIPESKPWVAGDADQGVCVVGEKRPLRHFLKCTGHIACFDMSEQGRRTPIRQIATHNYGNLTHAL